MSESFGAVVLAERYYKKWRRFVAKKTSGYVVYNGKSPFALHGDDTRYPTSTLYHHEFFGRDDRDHFPFPEIKTSVLSFPYESSSSFLHSMLNVLKNKNEKFVDKNFPPNEYSLFHDPSNIKEKSLETDVKKWVRISEMFTTERVIKSTFFDDEDLKLCGFETMELADFDTTAGEQCNFDQLAAKKALEICKATLTSSKAIDYSAKLFENSPIKDWLESNKIFEAIIAANAPLIFKDFVNIKIEKWEEAGYVPTISIIAKCLFGPVDQIKMFERETADEQLVKPGDVDQGALGDCYFLGAISVLAIDEPKLLECFPDLNLSANDQKAENREQVYNETGVYAVAFYKNRQRRVVVVDDYIPVNEYGKPVFCHPPRDSTEIWTMIAEKAYAKLNGSYEAIVGGLEKEALQELTGGLPLSYQISGPEMEERWAGPKGEERLWLFFKDDLKVGIQNSTCFVGCSKSGDGVNEADVRGSSNIGGNGILCNHAYGVLQVQDVLCHGISHRLIQVRNPWGSGIEWAGAWSDNDPNWKKVDQNTKKRLGFTNEDDGTWWMGFSDFKKEFDEIQVCRVLSNVPYWTHHLVLSKWDFGTAGGTESIHLNPQFQLVLKQDTKVYIELRQPSRRQLGKEKYDVAIGPVVVKNCERNKRKVIIRAEDIVGKLMLAHSRSRVLELELKASDSPYNIIACSSEKGFESEFFLEVYTRDNDQNCQACKTSRGQHSHSELLPITYADMARCAQCKQVLEGTFVTVEEHHIHKECFDSFKTSIAPKCAQCNGPVCQIDGRFSGRYYPIEEDQKVHLECYTDYQHRAAVPCAHCGQGVFKVEGKFSGVYYEVDNEGKVHEECWEPFRLSKAETCKQCGAPIARIEGRFSGKYYAVDDAKIHSECWDTHRRVTSPACVQCGEPCCEMGRFSGMFYELDDDKKCHVECFDSYSQSQK